MEEKNLSKLRILVVDNEVFVLNLCVRILKNIGCENVITANSGKQALEKLNQAQKNFDVIICDLNMPEIDGIEFMRHISEKNFTGGIILFSGEDQRILEVVRDLDKAHKLNVFGAIQKPLKPDVLKLLLDNYKSAQTKKKFTPQKPITEEELRTGLDGDELQLVFQPKVKIADGTIMGVEALARWHHADRGILGSGAFIPLAEKVGLINDLTYAIYKKAMIQTGEWHANAIDIKVSVNVSINNFTLEGFSDFLVTTAKEQGVDLSKVILEVTESQVMADVQGCLEILIQLRMKKFGLSMDDFGIGQSNMEQLKRIPFTALNIERAFVHGASYDSGARAILESSLQLAKRLNMETVAEGAETREDWDLVESLECDYVQGFYCAKPMPNEKLIEFIETWTGPH